MEAFCPKCDKEINGPDEALLAKGTCTECNGSQLYIGPLQRHKKYTDIIALNFVPGSQIAIPLEPSLHITNLETFDESTDKVDRADVSTEPPEITNVRPLEEPQQIEQTDVRTLAEIKADHDASQEPKDEVSDDAVTAVVSLKALEKDGTPVIHPEGNQREQSSVPDSQEPQAPMAENQGNSKKALFGIAAAILGVIVGLGVFSLAQKDNPVAKNEVAKPEEATPVKPPSEEAKSALAEGMAAYELENYPKAAELFTLALTDKNHASDAHRNLGITFARMNQYEKAVKHYRAYLKLSPDAPDAASVRKILSDYQQAK